jgi:hypothetical protein
MVGKIMVGKIATGELDESMGSAPNRAKGGVKGRKARAELTHYPLSQGFTQQTQWLIHGVINRFSTACPPGCQPAVPTVATRMRG